MREFVGFNKRRNRHIPTNWSGWFECQALSNDTRRNLVTTDNTPTLDGNRGDKKSSQVQEAKSLTRVCAVIRSPGILIGTVDES